MEQHRLASANLNLQNLRVADEANRVATLIASLSTEAQAADAATVVLKGLREIADLAAWAFVSEFEPADGARLTDLLETHRTSVRDFAAPFGRVAHLDAGIASATTLCGLFGRSWDAVFAARGEDAILDHLAQILIAANDLECAVFASRIAERAASHAAAGWLQ